MREDAHEDKNEIGARHALMQTYVDDPVQPGQENAVSISGLAGSEDDDHVQPGQENAASTSGLAGSEEGRGARSGLPQVA